jgi:RNA polymerase sigma factor (sigma-70 family)
MSDALKRTDAEIISLTLAGNRQVFAGLLNRYTQMACAIAYARLGNHDDMREAVQEAWVEAFQRLNTLRDRNHFGPWFLAIVRNVSVTVAKKRFIEQSARKNSGLDTSSGKGSDYEQQLWTLIVKHTPDHREVLTLHFYAGLDTDEIAKVTGDSRDTISKRIQRAQLELNPDLIARVFGGADQDSSRLKERVLSVVLAKHVSWLSQDGANGGGNFSYTTGRSNKSWLTMALLGIIAVVIVVGGWMALKGSSKKSYSGGYSTPSRSSSGSSYQITPKREFNDGQSEAAESIRKEFKK